MLSLGGGERVLSTTYVRDCWGTARLPREEEPRGDPTESVANEEASQLPAGKRVVPQQAQAPFPVKDQSNFVSVSYVLIRSMLQSSRQKIE